MSDASDYFVPIIAGLFIVFAAITGFCLYWFHLKTRKRQSGQKGQEEDSGKHSHAAQKKSAKFPSFKLNSNPFIFYMAPAPLEFCTTSVIDEGVESARSFPSPCDLRQEQPCVKPPEKKRVYKRTSNEISPRSPSRLQVIMEGEENEEVEDEKANV